MYAGNDEQDTLVKQHRFLRERRLWDYVDLVRTSPERAKDRLKRMERSELEYLYQDFEAARCVTFAALAKGALSQWSDDSLSDAADAIIERGLESMKRTLESRSTGLPETLLRRGSDAALFMIQIYNARFGGEISDAVDGDYWEK